MRGSTNVSQTSGVSGSVIAKAVQRFGGCFGMLYRGVCLVHLAPKRGFVWYSPPITLSPKPVTQTIMLHQQPTRLELESSTTDFQAVVLVARALTTVTKPMPLRAIHI